MKRTKPVAKKQPVEENKGALGAAVGLWTESVAEEAAVAAKKDADRMARKRARKAKKREKSESAHELLQQKAEEAEVIVALDMSTSPGLCIVDRHINPRLPSYLLFGFAQRDKHIRPFLAQSKSQSKSHTKSTESKTDAQSKSQSQSQSKSDTESTESKTDAQSKSHTNSTESKADGRSGVGIMGSLDPVIEVEEKGVGRVGVHVVRAPKDGTYEHNTEYYELITSKLMELILPRCQGRKCLVVIENYAFNVIKYKESTSVTGLAELGGVIRSKLWHAKLPFLEVPPTTIKKWFTGSGNADKVQMWKRFQEVLPKVLLKKWLPAPFPPNEIPNPHQDIVDAFAAAHSLHNLSIDAFRPTKKPKK
jgi:Holliday junction resolvasome RuvABC endonuclease subunit